jgi:hypothetical protein
VILRGVDRLDRDVVDDAPDAREVAHRAGHRLALIIPFDGTGERDPSLLRHHLDRTLGHAGHPLQRLLGGVRDVRIGSRPRACQGHVELDRQALHADDPLRGFLGRPLLGVGVHVARQRHDTVGHLDPDLRRFDCRIPLEFGDDVLLYL